MKNAKGEEMQEIEVDQSMFKQILTEHFRKQGKSLQSIGSKDSARGSLFANVVDGYEVGHCFI